MAASPLQTMPRYLFPSIVAVVVSSPPVLADNATEAEQQYNVGQSAFDAGRYDDAIAAWQYSYRLSNEPALLFNIGQAYRLRASPGDCTRATDAYRTFVSLDPASEQRQQADELIATLKSCADAEAQRSPVTAATPAIAPVVPPTAEMGNHGAPPVAGRTKRLAGIAIAGGGVLIVATGIYYGRRASSLGDEVSDACAIDCDWAVQGPKQADGQSAETKQYVFLGLGAAAVAGGGLLYWLGSRERSRTSLAVVPRHDGAAISWSGTW